VPEFVAAARAASDMYFDQVARVHVPDWSRGRIALLGDAASCVSLFGDGSTLAMAGAYQLAARIIDIDLRSYLDPVSYCPLVHEVLSNNSL